MKKIIITSIALCMLLSCTKDKLVFKEYWNGEANKIKMAYDDTNSGTHDQFSIYNQKGNAGNILKYGCHISYNHTLDAIKVEGANWLKLPVHFGEDSVSKTPIQTNDKLVSFAIRSKTPVDEIMTGSVVIAKPFNLSVEELGNNTFKLKWIAGSYNDNVLIYLNSLAFYTPNISGTYAVETNDDGEYILESAIFDKIDRTQTSGFKSENESLSVAIRRKVEGRKTTVKQLSTGVQYDVYGGSGESAVIKVKL